MRRRGAIRAFAGESGRKGARRSGRGVARVFVGRMEIVLAAGERILVGADVDTAALARVVKALSRR